MKKKKSTVSVSGLIELLSKFDGKLPVSFLYPQDKNPMIDAHRNEVISITQITTISKDPKGLETLVVILTGEKE